MADSNNPKGSRFDTRGLPEDYDPRRFYEYQVMKRSKDANGIEGLILKYMPYSVVRSLAFAVDPFAQFRTSAGRVSPKSRKIRRSLPDSPFTTIRFRKHFQEFAQRSAVNWENIPGKDGPLMDVSGPAIVTEGVRGTSPPLFRLRHDTTRRTRLIGSSIGEFELMNFQLQVPERTVVTNDMYRADYLMSPEQEYQAKYRARTVRTYTLSPTGYLSSSALESLLDRERAYSSELIQKNSVSMYAGLNPQFRNFSLFRDAVELRDLPRSILQLKDTAKNFTSLYSSISSASLREKIFSLGTSVRDIPKEYVGYHFGWKQLVKSLNDLLVKPEQASKQISLLITRSGKPTTYRAKRNIPSAVSDGVPGFDFYSGHEREVSVELKTRLQRTSELRMVINTTFDFPPVNQVLFAKRKFYDKLGLYPRPTDLYNLVPWTWLIDWFTGLGDYVNVIDEINRDKSLVNWGMISCVTTGHLITEAKSRSIQYSTVYVQPAEPVTETQNVYGYSSAILEYKFQMRNDLGAVPSVRRTTDLSSLTTYQQSILGSIISERTRARRR